MPRVRGSQGGTWLSSKCHCLFSFASCSWPDDQTASWDGLPCLGSFVELVLYPWLPLMRALTFDTMAWWYQTISCSASPPLAFLGWDAPLLLPSTPDLFHGVYPYPDHLRSCQAGVGGFIFYFFFSLQESLFGEYSHVACVPALPVRGLWGKCWCGARGQGLPVSVLNRTSASPKAAPLQLSG